jgi:hypothetical protein
LSDPSNACVIPTIVSAEATRAATNKTAAATYAASNGSAAAYATYIATRQAADTLCQATIDNARDSIRGTYIAR